MRDDDTFLPLDVRTGRANQQSNCVLISLHANWAANEQASGIETFCMEPRLFNPTIEMPHTHERWQKGNFLAHAVHDQVLTTLGRVYPITNRKVKHAVLQVLLGSLCPAILIELGFLSHPREAQMLGCPNYQQLLAKGICEGILTFIKSLQKSS